MGGMGNVLPPACYNVTVPHPNRMWQTDSVLSSELPVLALQVAFNALVGFLLTPQLLGRYPLTFQILFPVNGVLNVEVLSHIGLIYYAFLSGLEMNLNTIIQARKKAATIAFAGIIFPIVIAPGLYALHQKYYVPTIIGLEQDTTTKSYLLWTLVFTVTGFPVLAQTLAELKLHHTGLGHDALTAAMISDTYSWILFALLVPFSINGPKAAYSVLSTILFIVVCVFVVRPIIVKFIDRKTEQDAWDEHQLLFVVMGVLACSYITDILGTHGIVGAFVYGLILPHGRFADLLTSISDDFGGGFLAPLFFSGSGMRLMLATIFDQPHWPMTLLVILLLCIPKILSTIFATSLFGMRIKDGLALGLLLNTKGAIALILLNIAWDRKIFYPPTYAVVCSAVLLMTVVVSPIINGVFRPRKRFEQNKMKTVQKLRLDAELRILACVHNNHHASGMINILESFNATRLSPVHVFALYLVELTGRRAAALVAAHMEKRPGIQLGGAGVQNLTKSQEEFENITNTFKAFAEGYDAFRVETTSVVSAYATIHEDVYNSANERGTSLILLPFHKHSGSEAGLETTNAVYKDINNNVMQHAPCSVGIFVDRDLGSLSNMNIHINMLFVGGPDDREALAIAWKMAGHPKVKLSVIRFLLFDEAAEVETSTHNEAQGILSAVMDSEKQKELDEDYLSSFRLTAVNNEDSISYSEVDVHNGEDIPKILTELEQIACDLYIVGQGNCRNSQVFSDLLEWCDCLELGVIGDILASNIFGSASSVLVVQQYGYGGMDFGKQPGRKTTHVEGFESLVVKTE